jgi:hypothetical protein
VAFRKANNLPTYARPEPTPESEDDTILRKAKAITERRWKEAEALTKAKEEAKRKAKLESLIGKEITFRETKKEIFVYYDGYENHYGPELDTDFLTPLAKLYNELPLGVEVEITVKVLGLKS